MKKTFLSLINSRYLFIVTSFGWWLIFYPGFYSSDSFGALSQAKTGHISNIYTAAWPLTLRILTFGGRVPGFGTLACILLLSYSVVYFCRSALPELSAKFTAALLLVTPGIGAMGITLWHDIPMTAGLLLTLSVAIKSTNFKARLSKSDWTHLVFGVVLATLRPNGLATLFVFFLFLFLLERSARIIKFGLFSVIIALAFSTLTTWAVGERSLVSSVYAQEWMRSDVACAWATNPSKVSKDVQEELKRIAPLAQWNNAAGCTFLNNLRFSLDQVNRSTKTMPRIWLQVFKSDPIGILKTHAIRNAYLLPIPTTRAMHPPFINSIIEIPGQGISFAAPKVVAIFRPYVRAWNGLRPITSFAGLWLAVLLGMAFFSKRSRKSTLPVIAMSLALEGILFAFAPIPDGRYALPVLIVGQALALGFALDFFNRKRGQKQL
jgi:hypothetical protein